MTTDEPPRLFQHALALYNQLLSEASEECVFEGSLVAAFRAIGVSQSYYSVLYGALKELGCIEVVRSGRGGGASSRVILHHPPDLEAFQARYTGGLTKREPHGILGQRLENIEGRLPNIDLHSYIVETERRLESLEKQVTDLELRREG